MSIQIHVPVVNNPEFIKLQYNACKRFSKDPFVFVVFNDAKDFPDRSNWNKPEIKQQIEKTCSELGVACINVPNSEDIRMTSPSQRHSRTANFMWKSYQQNSEVPILTLDSDMFPIAPFSIISDLQSYDFAYVQQVRGGMPFAWPNLWWMNPTKIQKKDLIDWSSDVINGDTTDTGGKSWRWFWAKSDDIKTHVIKYQPSLQWNQDNCNSNVVESVLDFCKTDIKNVNGMFFCEVYEDRFLHLRAGSNWEGIDQQIHIQRTNALATLLHTGDLTK
jgi:hypothetical protein